MYKLMIFNEHGDLVGDIETTLLPYILDPVDKLPCDPFIPEIPGDDDVECNGQFPSLATCQPGISSETISTSSRVRSTIVPFIVKE